MVGKWGNGIWYESSSDCFIFSRKQDAYSSAVSEDEEKGLDGVKEAEKMWHGCLEK